MGSTVCLVNFTARYLFSFFQKMTTTLGHPIHVSISEAKLFFFFSFFILSTRLGIFFLSFHSCSDASLRYVVLFFFFPLLTPFFSSSFEIHFHSHVLRYHHFHIYSYIYIYIVIGCFPLFIFKSFFLFPHCHSRSVFCFGLFIFDFDVLLLLFT